MKKFFFLLLALLPVVAGAAEPYAVFNNETLSFYCDNNRNDRPGTKYDLNVGANAPDWLENKASIKKVVFSPSFANAHPTTTCYWFHNCRLSEIEGIKYLKTDKVTNMGSMFSMCDLTSLDLSTFDTNNVTDMSFMFAMSFYLKDINVSNFDTRKVTNMEGMFMRCYFLPSLDLSSFNPCNVTDMSQMFSGCETLESLNLSNFNTGSVTNTWQMFSSCVNLTSLDVSKFDTKNIVNMEGMFRGCRGLTSLDVSHFDTKNVKNMGYLFMDCVSLTSLDLRNFDTGNVENMKYMFDNCKNMTSLYVNSFDTRKVTDMPCMFNNCSSLTSLDISNFDTSIGVFMWELFGNCSSLESLILGDHFVSYETTGSAFGGEKTFYGCSKLNKVTFTGDIPSSINSKLFYYIGYVDSPVTLEVPAQYFDHYASKFDNGKFYGGYFTLRSSEPVVVDAITFADPVVENLCLYYWDTNKDGKLTKQEAAAVMSLGDVFCLNPQKTKSWQGSNGPKDGLQHGNFYSFDELQYFTGLTSIDDEAFYSQQSLQRITLPANVKKIGKRAFYYCWNLEAIDIPNAVETIGQGAFWSCKSAGSLSMGSSIKTIGDAAFRDCVSLSTVVVPDGCTAIGSSAFLGCTKLDALTLPASLKNVSTFMIAYTEKTVDISLGSKDLWQQLQMVCDEDEMEEGIVEQSDFKLYYNGQELTEVEIPQTMTKVDNRYKNCQSVKSLTIPAIVTEIAVCAFNGCRNLTSVTSYLQNPFYIEDAAFEYEDPNTHNDVFTSATLYVPKGTKAKYQSQYGWKSFKSVVEMDDEPVEAEPYVAYNNSGTLTFYYDNQRSSRGRTFDLNSEKEIPLWLQNGLGSTVRNVVFDVSFANARPTTAYEWFYGPNSLKTIQGIENLNTSEIENMEFMFQYCWGITELDLSHFDTKNVKRMTQMFLGCSSLEHLTLGPLFVTGENMICHHAFSDCTNLKTVTFTGDIPASINSKFFEGVGTADSPAALDVPEQYREHYKTKFDGNKFFGGYFTLSGVEPDRPQLEIELSILNAIDGIVYDEKPIYKISCKNNGTTKFEGRFLVKFYKPSDTGEWIANEDYPWTSFSINLGNGLMPGQTSWCSSSFPKANIGQNRFEYGYMTSDGTEFILDSVVFELRPDEHYVTIVQTADIMTYCDENDLDFTAVEGLKAYIVPGFNNDSREAIMMNVNDVPAMTGLLLVGAPQAYLVPKTKSSTIYVNMLKGLLKGESVPRTLNVCTNYVFMEGSQGFGFYLADEGGSYVYNKEAYLQVPTRVMNSRDFIGLTFDDTTAINGMSIGDQPFSVYTLSGVLVRSDASSLDGLPKGIYVVGGHKVVVK